MIVYTINGEKNSLTTEFSTILAKELSQKSKTLVISLERFPDKNLEDYYDKDGMIAYDICDYFLDYVDLDYIINKKDDNLDFIISPFVKDKYEIRKEDINKLLEKLDYDYIIFDNLSNDLLNDKISLDIILLEEIENQVDSDYFFINEVKEDFDQRLYKDILENKNSKYIGYVNLNGSYNHVIENLLDEKEEEISKIGFFEKIKMKFTK